MHIKGKCLNRYIYISGDIRKPTISTLEQLIESDMVIHEYKESIEDFIYEDSVELEKW
jgi:hypothetical protein